MATNFAGSQIKDSYEQILHVDGGPEATEKVVYSAVGETVVTTTNLAS